MQTYNKYTATERNKFTHCNTTINWWLVILTLTQIIMPRPSRRDIKRWCCLISVCLSVTYIRPKSRTERPRKTKIGTEVAHVTRDSDTSFKVKRSKVKVTGGGGILWRPPTQLVLHIGRCDTRYLTAELTPADREHKLSATLWLIKQKHKGTDTRALYERLVSQLLLVSLFHGMQ